MFYAWLNGPGAQLKRPLKGSTNYMGAYDRHGNLIRAGEGYQRRDAEGKDAEKDEAAPAKGKEGAEAEKPEEELSAHETEEVLQNAAKEEKADGKDNKGKKGEKDDKLPPEDLEDLRPFPKNKFFRSQPVLSEELREAIYQRVVRDGATVSLASVEFGVSNERVGAVVRLKQMEKEWIAQVCFQHSLFNCPRPLHDEFKNIRLVFKTPTWLDAFNIPEFGCSTCYLSAKPSISIC